MYLKEHCGVIAVSSASPLPLKLTYEGLKLLQHRGEESAGISYLEAGKVKLNRGLGLVEEAIDKAIILSYTTSSIGHVRYSTSGVSDISEAQPMSDGYVTVAFNGTITNFFKFGNYPTDTSFILDFISKEVKEGKTLIEAIRHFMEVADGAYSLLVMDIKGDIYAVRDPQGFRPLVLGRVNNAIVVASEDSAIRQLGGIKLKDLSPGEVIGIREGNIFLNEIVNSSRKTTCAFEFIYFSRADSSIDGNPVYISRIRLGEILAKKHPAPGEVVVPVPDSSRPIALGFSRASGIPLEEALIRTISSKRSFIMPTQEARIEALKEKFGIVESAVKGKSLVLIDDSIVRGNTMRRLISRLRSAGAKEIHVRVGSPMIKYPCYMGIDFPSASELIARSKNEEKISKEIGSDSLEFLTVDEMISAIGTTSLCDACFTGNYPLKGNYNFSSLDKIFGKV
ncbi:amidophosphoribosyltransferase [Sulfuracidifex metallicus]|uniref:Amidophosphoribosyltransferase n=1 Tax=Sulfuracidifex metallicus DSM 6482 = JCM 9184 TaxID=523847 RepID=A0A6A9QG35_SULME|nr:amidophosphoribosyltransferase [Sulfuracidifex metallicus]MUN28177.1 amidophosphoribosyltransferase [Sulfuracidifex metallicus DSM 6482 = JCM 9184]WOE51288.1 amidophosphoribosyltransferase [Sulfuracidifex metallicus DSM 6482 = JCM 9184]